MGEAMETGDLLMRQWLGEGLAHLQMGNGPAAIMAFKRVLSRDPNQIDAWSNIAAVLREQGRTAEALEACEKALVILPGHLPALCTRASLHGDMGEFENAEALYRQVLAVQPDYFVAQFHLGWALYQQGRLKEALEADDRTIALNSEVAAAHLNRGYTLMKLNRLDESEQAVLRALEIDPGLSLAHWNLAFVRLLAGRMKEAWPEFHWRWKVREALPGQRPFAQPQWKGEPFVGRTLLVWAEQGFGDSIQFVRYLSSVKALGGTVILQIQPALKSLMSTCLGADLVLSEQDALPPFDLQVPILDLPYLACPGVEVYQPKRALAQALADDGRVRIGLVWSGNPNQKDNRTRSIPASALEPLAALQEVAWFSLQKPQPGSPQEALPAALSARDLDPYLETFADTAFALDHLHLLITVDTSVAHLAGAMGCPALVLLSFSPDWRWLTEGEACPWYPTFRLYRQPSPGDWMSVVRRLVLDLQ
jgi:tetratricopeptide (TPR) repeat protein